MSSNEKLVSDQILEWVKKNTFEEVAWSYCSWMGTTMQDSMSNKDLANIFWYGEKTVCDMSLEEFTETLEKLFEDVRYEEPSLEHWETFVEWMNKRFLEQEQQNEIKKDNE